MHGSILLAENSQLHWSRVRMMSKKELNEYFDKKIFKTSLRNSLKSISKHAFHHKRRKISQMMDMSKEKKENDDVKIEEA